MMWGNNALNEILGEQGSADAISIFEALTGQFGSPIRIPMAFENGPIVAPNGDEFDHFDIGARSKEEAIGLLLKKIERFGRGKSGPIYWVCLPEFEETEYGTWLGHASLAIA